jgi:hypothetical protein
VGGLLERLSTPWAGAVVTVGVSVSPSSSEHGEISWRATPGWTRSVTVPVAHVGAVFPSAATWRTCVRVGLDPSPLTACHVKLSSPLNPLAGVYDHTPEPVPSGWLRVPCDGPVSST